MYWTGFPKPGSKNEKEILFKGEYYPPPSTGIDNLTDVHYYSEIDRG